jgi:hypothetical protein
MPEELLEKERAAAKERHRENGGDRKSKEYRKSAPQKIAEPKNKKSTNEFAEKVAKEFGTNHNYLRRTLKFEEERPDMFEKTQIKKPGDETG